MKKFKNFYFESFDINLETFIAKFYYSFDNEVFFDEEIDFSNLGFNLRENLDLEILNNLLFHLHIALGISYYKAYPTEKLILNSGFLDENQISFWKKFYINGLGEYLFRNNISIENLFNFVNNSDIKYIKKDFLVSNKSLVSIGGGKDSIVSIELLKNSNIDFDLFVFGKTDKLKNFTKEISLKKSLLVKRKISDTLFKLNAEGYYNGHVPITGIIAFVKEVVAYLYDYKYLILSNEKSANFGNTVWNGIEINHQYSKSLEFEKDFKNYVENYISSNTKYFSLLRGMYETKIAELFSYLGKKYFSSFSSCNNNFKIASKSENTEKGVLWCNSCPKCLFVFSILRPYLSNEEVLEIFGEDLFQRKDLENGFRELLGISGIKPFECVGESDEVVYSMFKSLGNYSNPEEVFILKIFLDEVLEKLEKKDLENIEKKLVRIYSEDIIDSDFKKLIFKNNNIDEEK